MKRRTLLAAGAGLMAGAGWSAHVAADAAAGLIRRRIPASGEELPLIGLGTSGPFEVATDPSARAPLLQVLERFFAAGARLIDTSPMYTTAEGVLGELLTDEMHARAFLATKVWTRSERAGIEQMSRSAQLLKTARLDLIQVHNLLDLDTQLKTLYAWKAAGRVRYVGVTHYTVSAHADLARVLSSEKLDFVQFNYSPLTRAAEKRLLPLAAERGDRPAVRLKPPRAARAQRAAIGARAGGGVHGAPRAALAAGSAAARSGSRETPGAPPVSARPSSPCARGWPAAAGRSPGCGRGCCCAIRAAAGWSRRGAAGRPPRRRPAGRASARCARCGRRRSPRRAAARLPAARCRRHGA